MKIVLARIFIYFSSLRERPANEQKELRSSGEPQRGGFANGARLNVTRAILPTAAANHHYFNHPPSSKKYEKTHPKNAASKALAPTIYLISPNSVPESKPYAN